jgi:hypothetical protein
LSAQRLLLQQHLAAEGPLVPALLLLLLLLLVAAWWQRQEP